MIPGAPAAWSPNKWVANGTFLASDQLQDHLEFGPMDLTAADGFKFNCYDGYIDATFDR